jgi:xylitol oxidase
MPEQLYNWARNIRYSTDLIHEPRNIEELRELTASGNHLKVIGTRHSFNTIADSEHQLVSLRHFNRIVELDREHQTVTVEAGIRYGDLCPFLHRNGYALHNLASLPHISVVGACATATHGSGDKNQNLSTAVRAMEIVTANGDVVTVSRETNEDFSGMVVGLGALGIMTKLTLDLSPAFQTRQIVYEQLPLAHLKENFDDIFGRAYSVSLFTDWRQPGFHQVWLKQVVDQDRFEPETKWFDATLATANLHPLPGHSAEHCTEQTGIPGPWHERLPHFRMAFTPSSGDELQSEYFVARHNAYEALCAIDRLREQIAPLVYVTEVRTIAADDLWMSPSYKQDAVGIHFTWKKDWESVQRILPLIEQQLQPFRPRPHWGKLFTMKPDEVKACYERLPDFQKLINRYDPQGKFRNAFLRKYLY